MTKRVFGIALIGIPILLLLIATSLPSRAQVVPPPPNLPIPPCVAPVVQSCSAGPVSDAVEFLGHASITDADGDNGVDIIGDSGGFNFSTYMGYAVCWSDPDIQYDGSAQPEVGASATGTTVVSPGCSLTVIGGTFVNQVCGTGTASGIANLAGPDSALSAPFDLYFNGPIAIVFASLDGEPVYGVVDTGPSPGDVPSGDDCAHSYTLSGFLVAWEPPGSDPIPTPSGTYASSDCAGPGSVAIFDGFADSAHATIRTAPSGTNTLVCAAVDEGVHLGGEAVISGANPGELVDGNQPACASDAANTHVTSGFVGPQNAPYSMDVTPHANDVWVCVLATTLVSERIVIPVGTAGGLVGFVADPGAPYAYTPEPPTNSTRPSSACQLATTGTVNDLLNADAAMSHAWLYTWQESATRVDVCARVEGPDSAGGRLTVDASGSQTIASIASDATPCTFNIITSGQPPFFLRLSDPTRGLPASLCIGEATTVVRVTIASGGQGIVTWTPDP